MISSQWRYEKYASQLLDKVEVNKIEYGELQGEDIPWACKTALEMVVLIIYIFLTANTEWTLKSLQHF